MSFPKHFPFLQPWSVKNKICNVSKKKENIRPLSLIGHVDNSYSWGPAPWGFRIIAPGLSRSMNHTRKLCFPFFNECTFPYFFSVPEWAAPITGNFVEARGPGFFHPYLLIKSKHHERNLYNYNCRLLANIKTRKIKASVIFWKKMAVVMIRINKAHSGVVWKCSGLTFFCEMLYYL